MSRVVFRLSPAVRRCQVLFAAGLLVIGLAGCSGDKDSPNADPQPKETSSSATPTTEPTATATADPVKAVPINNNRVGRIKPRMPKSRVIQLLGAEPLLTQTPFDQFTGGCIYYSMAGRPLSDLWQFCFNDEGVSVILTAFSPDYPAPPEGASDVRAALLARGDTVCQSQYGHLRGITSDVTIALDNYAAEANDDNNDTVVRQIGRFVENLDLTRQQLAAFVPPADESAALTEYLSTLESQARKLEEVADAFAEGDIDAYAELGGEFNKLGQVATVAARKYGFTTCTSSRWG